MHDNKFELLSRDKSQMSRMNKPADGIKHWMQRYLSMLQKYEHEWQKILMVYSNQLLANCNRIFGHSNCCNLLVWSNMKLMLKKKKKRVLPNFIEKRHSKINGSKTFSQFQLVECRYKFKLLPRRFSSNHVVLVLTCDFTLYEMHLLYFKLCDVTFSL